jgi:hypothetical protein
MADVDKILRLVSEGVLSPEEADEILGAVGGQAGRMVEPDPAPDSEASRPAPGGRHLRVQVSDGSRQVVNLRVPMNLAGWASAFLPGLPDGTADRIRGVMASGERGPILDISGDDGSHVLIVSE